MKVLFALLATLVASGYGRDLWRSKPLPSPHAEQEWISAFPEITKPKIQEPTFKDGGEYRYLYDGQILTGLPDVYNQFSGIRIRALVKLQLGGKDLMQIEKVFVGSLHERFVSNPRTIIDLSAFEPMTEQDAPFEEVLKKPVRFTYENGKVDNFETTEDDPSWSINIKRSILSTFHLSLTEREEPKDESRREYLQINKESNKSGRKPTSDETDDDEFFTVVEDNVAGRCEVSYIVLQVPDEDSSVYPIYTNEKSTRPKPNFGNVLNVTKTWDRKNCEYRPFVYNGFHLSNQCPTCESNPADFFDLLESTGHARYNITGTKQDFIIDSAITEAVYSFTPRSHYAGSLMAYANMTFVLIQSGPAKTPISFPEGKSNKIDGLHMIDPIFLKSEGETVLMTTPEADQPIVQKKDYWPNVDEKPRKIKALFEKLITGMDKKEIDTETAVLVQRIVGLLEYAEEDELKEIHEQIKTVSASGVQKEEVEHLFADLLVATGSRCTFTYIKTLLTEKKLEGPVVVDVLAMLPLKMDTSKISPETIKNFEQLCKSDTVEQSVFAKRSCWLAFGTLVNRACIHKTFDARVQWPLSKPDAPKPSKKTYGSDEDTVENLRCPVELRRSIVEEALNKLKSASDEETKILVIKTIGNMGLPETVDELADVAEDESVPLYIRTQAIWAMRSTEMEARDVEVTETLLPLYRKTSNPTALRIAAFLSILSTQPDFPILQDIAQSLNREVDLDVASYVYSSLSAIGNSTDPCLKNLTKDVQLALEFATPVNIDGRHSKSMAYGHYSKAMKGGLYWEVNKLADTDAPFVPRSGNFRLHTTMMDKSFDLIEFGFETEGLGDAFRKYIGNLTSEHMEEVLAGRVPSPIRHPRDVNEPLPVQNIEEINRVLNIKPTEPKDIRGSAYLKIFGQETRFVVINPTTLSRFLVDFITQQDSVIPRLTGEGLPIDNRRATLLADVKTEMPTIMGIPIRNSLSIPVVASMKGSIKASMTPKPEPGFGFFKKLSQSQITVDHDVTTTIAGEIHRKLSVFLGFIRVGAGTRSRMSFTTTIDAKWELNIKDRMSKLTMDMPESPVNLVKIETYPVTFVWRMSRKAETYQPKPVTPALPHTATQWTEKNTTPDDEEMNKPVFHATSPQGEQRFINMTIEVPSTEMMNPNGQIIMKTWIGLPISVPEMWEIPTPTFVKSINTTMKIGDETTPVLVKVNFAHELPHVKAPTIRQVGDKGVLKVKLIPKEKQMTFTVYERSILSMKSEQEMLNQLKDKVADIPVKDLSKSNPPADYNKYPKVGRSLQWTISSTAAPETWTTRGLLAVIYSMPGQYVKTIGAFESKIPAFAKKGCLTAEYRYPDRTGLWFMTPQKTLEKSVQGNVEMSWGDECGGDKMIKARIRIQKTDEQMQAEKNGLYDVNGIPVAFEVASQVHEDESLFNSLWKECEEDRQNGAFFSKDCVDLAVRYAELLKIKFDIEFKNVSPVVRKLVWRMERFVKSQYWYNSDILDMDVKNPENKINGVIEYSADRQYLDLSYATPHQNVKFVNIDLPFVRPHANALFPWTPARLVGLTDYPTCTLSGHKLNTFDDVSDDLPLSQCYHLMTKDADDDNLFAVLVAAAGKNTPAKKVLIIFGDHKIEIVPKNNQVPTGTVESPIDVTTQYIVKYNGQVLPESMNKDKAISIPPTTPEDKEALAMIVVPMPSITGTTVPIVKVVSPAIGISVLFDGASVTVEPVPAWKNNLVGLCGTFNGQTWDDKMLPNKTVVEEPRALSRAYLIKANNCDEEVPEVYFKPSVKKL